MSIGEEERLKPMKTFLLRLNSPLGWWGKRRPFEGSSREATSPLVRAQFEVVYLDRVQGVAHNHTGGSWE